jgi:hypothetical protein
MQPNLLVVVVQRQNGNIIHQQPKLESLAMEVQQRFQCILLVSGESTQLESHIQEVFHSLLWVPNNLTFLTRGSGSVT